MDIQNFCDLVTEKFVSEYPGLQEKGLLIFRPQEESMVCGVVVPVPIDRIKPKFEIFSINWSRIGSKIYLRTVEVDAPLSWSEHEKLNGS